MTTEGENRSMHFGVIYLLTNRVNGKRYVGQTTLNMMERWRLHQSSTSGCRALVSAITKHGASAFEVTELAKANSAEELNALEQHFVNALQSMAPAGYNLKEGGGSAGRWGEGQRRRMQELVATPAYIEKLRANSEAMWAKPGIKARISNAIRVGLSKPEVKAKRSAIAVARAAHPDTKARISASQLTRFKDQSQRDKISRQSIERWSDQELRTKMLTKRAARNTDPEYLEKVRQNTKSQWSDPAYRAGMEVVLKAAREKRWASRSA